MELRLNQGYAPHPHQIRAHESGARFLALAAGVRGGKTKCGAAEFLFRMRRDLRDGKARKAQGRGRQRRPALHYWVVAPIAGLLKEPIRYFFESLPPELIETWYESDKSLWLKGDILIEFKTADNPLHLVASGLDGVWIDEAARIKPDAWRGQLRQRLSDRRGWGLFSTTPLGKNWFHEEIVAKDGIDPEFKTITWTTEQNPYIPREEIESARRQQPARYFAREYLASFDAFAGTIYDEWNEAVHVVSEQTICREYNWQGRPLRELFRRCIAGVDWGWSSPGAIVVIGDTGRELLIVEESYASHRLISDVRPDTSTWVGEAQRLKRLWNTSQFYCDPSSPGDIFEFTRNGLSAVGGHNDVSYGLRKMATALHPDDRKTPRLRVLAGCVNLRREMKSYVFKPAKDGLNFTEIPEDGLSDHSLDAARYGVVELNRYDTGNQPNPNRRAGPIY